MMVANYKNKTIAFFPAHPAQLWLMIAVKDWLDRNGYDYKFIWYFRDKDITLKLARELGLNGCVVSKASSGFLGNALELFVNIFKCFFYTKRHRVDLWVTKYGCGNIAAYLCGAKSISFNDDDEDVVPLIAKTSYPFADRLIFPVFTRNYRYCNKATYYQGLHEVAYLVKNSTAKISYDESEPYAFIRVSALAAHHDVGHRGFSIELLTKIVALFEDNGIRVYISSEQSLPSRFDSSVINVDVSRIHQFLRGARFYIGDSQTMAIEASILEVPTIRISDFSNLSVINHLEERGLIKSFLPDDFAVLEYLNNYLENYGSYSRSLHQAVENLLGTYDDTSAVFGKEIVSLLGD